MINNGKLFFLLAAAVTVVASNSASSADSLDIASKLGPVLAAEKPCEFTYDPAAIAAYVEKTVSATDMEFVQYLDTKTWSSGQSIENMSASSKVAFCTQEGRVAKAAGFMK